MDKASQRRLQVKRAYDPIEGSDGTRVLVDGMWPRGIRKDQLRISDWVKEAAPSAALRKWFGHDPARWQAFKHAFFAELDDRPQAIRRLREHLQHADRVTLIYAAKDREHNNAVALREYLLERA